MIDDIGDSTARNLILGLYGEVAGAPQLALASLMNGSPNLRVFGSSGCIEPVQRMRSAPYQDHKRFFGTLDGRRLLLSASYFQPDGADDRDIEHPHWQPFIIPARLGRLLYQGDSWEGWRRPELALRYRVWLPLRPMGPAIDDGHYPEWEAVPWRDGDLLPAAWHEARRIMLRGFTKTWEGLDVEDRIRRISC